MRTFKVGKIGGFFSDIADTAKSAQNFANRQLDTVIDISGTVKSGAQTAQNAISGGNKTPKPEETGIVSSISSVSPVVWVGAIAALAFLFAGKKR